MSRIGRIEVSNHLLTDENIGNLFPLFTKFIPTFIDKNYPNKTVYYGWSEFFDNVNLKEGEEPPFYDPKFRNNYGVFELVSLNRL